MSATFVPKDIIIADATVLINFINSGQFPLLLRVFQDKLHVTDIVKSEIISGRATLDAAISSGQITEHPTNIATLAHLVKSFSAFDAGEASCLLLAEKNCWRIATDDGAAKGHIMQKLGKAYVVTTFDILFTANSLGYISKSQAISIVEKMVTDSNFLFSPSVFKSFRDSLI